MQSEAASESSPAAGPAKSTRSRRASRPSKAATFEVTFESQRMRHLGWALFHLSFGGLLVIALGTVAKGIGAFFLLLGALRGYKFVRRIGTEATVSITKDTISLPKTLTTRDKDRGRFTPDEIANVFYLRRSLPWFRISPVLIIETASTGDDPGQVYKFPRDWFASDADQRRVAETLTGRLGRQLPGELVSPLEASDPVKEKTATSRRNRALGFFMGAGALVMIGNLGFTLRFGPVLLPTGLLYVGAGLSFVAGAYFLLFAPPGDGNQASAKQSPKKGGSS